MNLQPCARPRPRHGGQRGALGSSGEQNKLPAVRDAAHHDRCTVFNKRLRRGNGGRWTPLHLRFHRRLFPPPVHGHDTDRRVSLRPITWASVTQWPEIASGASALPWIPMAGICRV